MERVIQTGDIHSSMYIKKRLESHLLTVILAEEISSRPCTNVDELTTNRVANYIEFDILMIKFDGEGIGFWCVWCQGQISNKPMLHKPTNVLVKQQKHCSSFEIPLQISRTFFSHCPLSYLFSYTYHLLSYQIFLLNYAHLNQKNDRESFRTGVPNLYATVQQLKLQKCWLTTSPTFF